MNKNKNFARSALGSLYTATVKKSAGKAPGGFSRFMAKRVSKAFQKPCSVPRFTPTRAESASILTCDSSL